MISFGKYNGKTFADVRATDYKYCQWVLAQIPTPNSLLVPFRNYLHANPPVKPPRRKRITKKYLESLNQPPLEEKKGIKRRAPDYTILTEDGCSNIKTWVFKKPSKLECDALLSRLSSEDEIMNWSWVHELEEYPRRLSNTMRKRLIDIIEHGGRVEVAKDIDEVFNSLKVAHFEQKNEKKKPKKVKDDDVAKLRARIVDKIGDCIRKKKFYDTVSKTKVEVTIKRINRERLLAAFNGNFTSTIHNGTRVDTKRLGPEEIEHYLKNFDPAALIHSKDYGVEMGLYKLTYEHGDVKFVEDVGSISGTLTFCVKFNGYQYDGDLADMDYKINRMIGRMRGYNYGFGGRGRFY